MEALKSFSNKTLRRKGYVLIGDILLPIHTRGMLELRQNLKKVKDEQDLPMKIEVANEDEKNALRIFGYDLKKIPLSINKIDEKSKKYIQFQKNLESLNIFFKIAINIDLEYPVEGGQSIWEHLGLADNEDYIGMSKWISSLEMVEKEHIIILKTIEIIKDSNNKEYEDWSDKILETYAPYLLGDNNESSELK